MELRVACVILWMLQGQAAVPEEFIGARRSVLVENERKVQKATWLGVEDIHGESRVDLHPSLVGDMQERCQSMPGDRAVFENVPSTMLQPNSAWCVLSGGVWRKLRREGKAYVMGLRHACRSIEILKSFWTRWPWY